MSAARPDNLITNEVDNKSQFRLIHVFAWLALAAVGLALAAIDVNDDPLPWSRYCGLLLISFAISDPIARLARPRFGRLISTLMQWVIVVGFTAFVISVLNAR